MGVNEAVFLALVSLLVNVEGATCPPHKVEEGRKLAAVGEWSTPGLEGLARKACDKERVKQY